MKEIEIKSTIKVYQNIEELGDHTEIELCKKSIEARKNSYAIYSNFQVGSAVLMDNGKIVLGSNQENAVFPLGLCAERVAIFSANNIYSDSNIIKLAVSTCATENSSELPVFPCGSCRHVIAEEESKTDQKIKIFVVAHDLRVFVFDSIEAILPFPMKKDSL